MFLPCAQQLRTIRGMKADIAPAAALAASAEGLTPHYRKGKHVGWSKTIRGETRWICSVNAAPTAESADRIYRSRSTELWGEAAQDEVSESAADAEVLEVINLFLYRRQQRVDAAKMERSTFEEYKSILTDFADFSGDGDAAVQGRIDGRGRIGEARLRRLTPENFDDYAASLAKRFGLHRRNKYIIVVRMMFKWASNNAGTDFVPPYGDEFSPARRSEFRRARNKRNKTDPETFTPEEVRTLLAGRRIEYKLRKTVQARLVRSSPQMRAMILLALNAGYHNKDMATMPLSVAEGLLKNPWLEYSRGKTGAERRAWIWPETVTAIEKYLRVRPTPAEQFKDLLFLTRFGKPYLAEKRSGKSSKWLRKDMIGNRLGELMDRLGMRRQGRRFRAFRKTYRTTASEIGDEMVIDLTMGHADSIDDMRSIYTVTVLDRKLKRVSEHVRKRFGITSLSEELHASDCEIARAKRSTASERAYAGL